MPLFTKFVDKNSEGGENERVARRIVRFNENQAQLQQQLQEQRKSSNNNVSKSNAVPATATTTTQQNNNIGNNDSVLGFFSRILRWSTVTSAAASASSSASAQIEGQQKDAASSTSSNDPLLSNLPQHSEQRKREQLARQLGRSPASISGPELDAIAAGLSWRELPPCPIFGMKLTEQGLYDSDIGRHYSSDEVRSLINETGKLEAKANMEAESRLGITSWRRITELMFDAGRFGSVCVMGWFWGMKLWQAFVQGFPRRSVIFKHYYMRRFPDLDAPAQEELCQRKKLLFTATNPRVLAFFGFGLAALALVVWGELARRRPDDFRQVNKFIVQQGQHYEGTMKWLFAVYYHHPAYAPEANTKQSRSLQMSEMAYPVMNPDTPNWNQRRNAWEDKIPNR